MLTRRTNILLNEFDYLALNQLAQKSKKTMGELIRDAITGFYRLEKKTESIDDVLKQVHRLGKKINMKGVGYKEMVNYGRKY